jgi:hypothetical protein
MLAGCSLMCEAAKYCTHEVWSSLLPDHMMTSAGEVRVSLVFS